MGSVLQFPTPSAPDDPSTDDLAALRGIFEFARLSAQDLADDRLKRACDLCCALVDEVIEQKSRPR